MLQYRRDIDYEKVGKKRDDAKIVGEKWQMSD